MEIKSSIITIMVKDMDRSIQFYQKIGLELVQRWDNFYAIMKTEGITIGIHPSEHEVQSSGTVSIGFTLDDLANCKKILGKEKIVYREEDDENSGIYLHFKDPDGTMLHFVKPKW